MVSCCVPGCKKRTQKGLRGISFHCFPKKPELSKAWIVAIGRLNWEPTEFSKICSLHFKYEDFIRQGFYTRLKKTAIPSNVEKVVKIRKRTCCLVNPSEREAKLMEKVKHLRQMVVEKNKLISVLRLKIKRKNDRLLRIKIYNAANKKGAKNTAFTDEKDVTSTKKDSGDEIDLKSVQKIYSTVKNEKASSEKDPLLVAH